MPFLLLRTGALLLALSAFVTCGVRPISQPPSLAGVRERQLFDFDWRFLAADVAGSEQPVVNDAAWERVDLPHDFMIEGKGQAIVVPGGRGGRGNANLPTTPEGPFDPQSPGGSGNGYLNGGIGWYRKSFTLPPADAGKRVFIEFEGVYMNAEVWLNGRSLGKRPYGYSTFVHDLTPLLKFDGTPNVIAVKVVVHQPSTRWYSGAGIYRHVWLTVADPVHVAQWGTFVTTTEIRPEQARVHVRTDVENQGAADLSGVTLTTIVRTRDGDVVGEAERALPIAAGGTSRFESDVVVPRPHLWSIEQPYLYTVENLVKINSRVVDVDRAPLGFRTVQFTNEGGILLNGARVPIQGVCLHHDLGPLGAAAFDRGIERQLEIMKSMGVNAVRTSHNPPAPALLDAADRLGLLVMNEVFDEWRQNKTRFGYGQFFDEWSERDMRDFVRRDRNHPSVFMWSIGNEIPEQRNAEAGQAMSTRLAGFVRDEDPTRPVSAGMNNPTQALDTGYAKPLDLFGVNYNLQVYERVRGIGHAYASETSSNYSSRDQYNLVLKDGRVEIVNQVDNHTTSYDLDFPRWGNTAETQFQALRRSPWMAGEFVWTGFDYIGEPTPFTWPNRSSSFGIVDLAGFPKDRYYLYKSQWRPEKMVHLLPHWTWPDDFRGKTIPVWAYTNAQSVELFLNDRSLGVRNWSGVALLHLAWEVPYEPGTLRAVARDDGRDVAEDSVQTTTAASRLELQVDRAAIRADGQDLAFVTVRIVDAEGRLSRVDGDHLVTFDLTGPGGIAGVDNGDPKNHEPFKGPTPGTARHRAFNGLALVVVRSARTAGALVLRARADGLAPAEVRIQAK
jgi:beta-galactosidase